MSPSPSPECSTPTTHSELSTPSEPPASFAPPMPSEPPSPSAPSASPMPPAPRYSSLKPNGYLPRIVDRLMERYKQGFGGVEVCGPRWCGKSWTAAAFAGSITRVDDNPLIYEDDPALALEGTAPHVIDEWQDVPAIWNAVRHRIDDEANRPGQFILTGSSTPPRSKRRHSGAGRIGRLRMHTMTLAETGESTGAVSLSGLFEGYFAPSRDELGLRAIAQIVCRGGWPALQDNPALDASGLIDEYLDLLFSVSMAREHKSPALARRIAQSLARNVATNATLKTIATDAARGEGRVPSADTVSSYLEALCRNYVIFELPGWDAPIRSVSRLRVRPKRYFDDPSLATSLLSVTPERLLHNRQLFGLLFESLCIHDLAVYASLLPGAGFQPLRYYGDADGLEVDVIIELSDGRWAGIEVKLGESKVASAAKNLNRLRRKVAANPSARNPEPAFMAALLGKCEIARYQAKDDIYVIPIGTLGP